MMDVSHEAAPTPRAQLIDRFNVYFPLSHTQHNKVADIIQ